MCRCLRGWEPRAKRKEIGPTRGARLHWSGDPVNGDKETHIAHVLWGWDAIGKLPFARARACLFACLCEECGSWLEKGANF